MNFFVPAPLLVIPAKAGTHEHGHLRQGQEPSP